MYYLRNFRFETTARGNAALGARAVRRLSPGGGQVFVLVSLGLYRRWPQYTR